jgi:Na+/H+-dicarboxylate symporter
MDVGLGGQVAIAGAAILAAMGIAGIPEAGLVVLPVVLAASGLPEAVIAVAVPLVVPVDWILARARSVVNVMSDMVVAIAVDGAER